jgi:dihydrofolate reductase
MHVRARAGACHRQARRTVEHDGHVIKGGGDVIGQPIEQGLVDGLRLHLAAVLFGAGMPLFRPGAPQRHRPVDVRPTTNAVYLTTSKWHAGH